MKKSDTGYKIIIVICAALIIAMSSKMFLRGRHSDVYSDPRISSDSKNEHKRFFLSELLPKSNVGITLTEEQLGELIRDKLPPVFPVNSLSICLGDDQSIGLTCKFEKQAFFDYLAENNFEASPLLKSSINFLPDPLEFSAVFSAETDPESNLLKINAVSVRINDSELNQGVILTSVSEIITSATNKALCESDYYFTDISISDGSMELTVR